MQTALSRIPALTWPYGGPGGRPGPLPAQPGELRDRRAVARKLLTRAYHLLTDLARASADGKT
jgi:hypothetical protein